MNLNFFRKVDYFIGIPICFVLTLVQKVIDFFRNDDKTDPQSILFIKMLGMGSVILSFPLLIETRKKYPNAKIYFLTFSSNKEVPTLLNGLVDGVFTISTKSAIGFIRDYLLSLVAIRKARIDTVFDLEFFSRFSAITTFLTFSKKRIGFYNYHIEGFYRGDIYNYKVYYNHYLHTAKQYLTMLGALSSEREERPLVKTEVSLLGLNFPRYTSSKEEKEKILKILTSIDNRVNDKTTLYLINNNASELAKDLKKWEDKKFAKVADELVAKDKNSFVLLVGSPAEYDENEKIFKLIKTDRKMNFAGKCSLRELLTLFNMSKFFITLDSGLFHLASLTDVSVIGLFSIETPLLYGPVKEKDRVIYKNLSCQPCLTVYNGKRAYCNNNLCVKSISVEDVLSLIK